MEYTYKNKLRNTHGWKWARKIKKLATKYVKLIARVNALQAKKKRTRNKFKFETIPDMPICWTN